MLKKLEVSVHANETIIFDDRRETGGLVAPTWSPTETSGKPVLVGILRRARWGSGCQTAARSAGRLILGVPQS